MVEFFHDGSLLGFRGESCILCSHPLAAVVVAGEHPAAAFLG